MRRVLPLCLTLAACGDWKDLPPPPPDDRPPPVLVPLEEIPPAPEAPPDTGEELTARAKALQARADVIRSQ